MAKSYRPLPQKQSLKSSSVHLTTKTSYEGPLPPPTHFQQYEETLPGSAERILRMTEAEQVNRHKLEAYHAEKQFLLQKEQIDLNRYVVKSINFIRIFSLILATLIIFGALGMGCYLTIIDKKWEGILSILGGLGLVVGAILHYEHKQDSEKK